MNIKILRNVIAGGKVRLKGAVLEAGKDLAKKLVDHLIEEGHAEEHTAAAEDDGGKSLNNPPKGVLRTDGPTFEEWTESGRNAADYPPSGYADLRKPVPK